MHSISGGGATPGHWALTGTWERTGMTSPPLALCTVWPAVNHASEMWFYMWHHIAPYQREEIAGEDS